MSKAYSIGPITGIVKPRYKVLSTILGEDFNPKHGLDVYIDLNTLVSALASSQKFQNSLPFSENVEIDIISGILMILKHWKDFTKKWEDVRIIMFVNDFEMVATAEYDTLNSYLFPYVNKFRQDRYKQFVYYWTEAIKKVEVILKYVPHSYIIRCTRFDSYVIPNILDDYTKNNRQRIVISGNVFMTNYLGMKNTKMIYSKYKHTGMCQMADPNMIVQSVTKIDDDIMSTFIKNKVFYNMLLTIVGDFDRGIIGLTHVGLTSFATDLLRSVEKREIPEDPRSIESVLAAVDEAFHDYLKKSYPLVDIDTHSMLVPKSQLEKVKAKMIDLYDIDGLRSLSIDGLNLLELL